MSFINERDVRMLAEKLGWRTIPLPDDESVQFQMPSGRLSAVYTLQDALRMLMNTRAAA